MDSEPDPQRALVAPIETLLASGGDTRLVLDPVTRLNGYGCRPFPRPDAFTFASSTATSISGRAYAAAAAARQRLLRESARRGFAHAFAGEMQALRHELKTLMGIEESGCEIVFSPSGTDSQLHAAVLAHAIFGAPLTSIVAAADETGSGAVFAASARHFNAATAQGIAVVKGDRLAGVEDEIECVTIAARTERGAPRGLAEMDAELADRIAERLAAKRQVLLFAMDSSKFGLRAPSTEALRRLAARAGDGLHIVIDACQTRLGRKRLRFYLDQGFMVLLTGSKFFTGAPFSGALLLPRAIAACCRALDRVPAGLREYSNRDDWPEGFAGLRAALPRHANLGMWLRWVSALEEMRDYFAVPLSFREFALRQFAETVPQLIAAESAIEAVPIEVPAREETDDQELALRTIFPFIVKRNGRALSQAQAVTLYQALNDDMSPFLPTLLPPMQRLLAARRCHIGQPVPLPDGQGGFRGALRVSAGARVVSENWILDLTRARARLRGEFDQIRAILEKIRLLVRHFDDIEPAYARSRAAAPRGQRGMSALLWQQPADAPLGVAILSKLAFDGADLGPLRSQLLDKYVFEPENAAALMDLAVIEQLLGNIGDGLARQQEALALRRVYRRPCAAAEPRLRLLAFAAPGDIGNNTPVEFLLEDPGIELSTLYIVPGETSPAEIPAHDVAIVTVCESDENRAALMEIARLARGWPKPVLNHPDQIAFLSRERLHTLVKPVPSIEMPVTIRIDRTTLGEIAAGRTALRAHLADGAFPLIARPIGSHAGRGLKKLDDPASLQAYLAERSEGGFYLSRYVDYRSPDGLFRKYRIVFVDGRPYACHMAIADQWMIYYLNAGMSESAAKKIEEERFMTAFAEEFARRHRAALAALADRIGLDYFGIDCAQSPDGRLLLFEADIAMIVHLMDSPAIFPYKVAPMRKIFTAFAAMIEERAAPAPRRRTDSAA